MPKRKTHEQFLQEVIDKYKDEYTVMGQYINSRTSIIMKHNICNTEYPVLPQSFTRGDKCPKCFGSPRKTTEQYKKEVFDLVGDEYEVLGEYKGNKVHILMKHVKCDREYLVKPNVFLSNVRCRKCSMQIAGDKQRKPHEVFVKEVFQLVGDEYSVVSKYMGAAKKVQMKHSKCDYTWGILSNDFLYGVRCPKCYSSRGEAKIEKWLEDYNWSYQRQYKFEDCKFRQALPFDFAVFEEGLLKMLIEFDGQQHFEKTGHANGEKKFEETKIRDNIKNNYCKEKNISLLRIPYWDFDDIEEILSNKLV